MRRVILCLMLAAMLVIPAAAQGRVPVPDIVRYAEYAPGDAALYAAIRMDAGFRESMDALLARLEPLIGDTDISDFFEDIFNEDDLFSFAGDALVLTVLTPEADFGDLLDDGSRVTITFGIKDFEAAKAFIEEGLEAPVQERNGWLIYEEPDTARAMLRGDIMIISPDFAFTDQLISGDYGKLTNDARFQDTLARLPLPTYDFIVYARLGEILAAQANRPEPVTEGREDDSAPDTAPDTAASDAAETVLNAESALIDALGSVAIGGVNVGGRDLLLDAAVLYGDTDALTASGFDLEDLGAPAVDLTFASRVAADTQFYAQSTNAGGLLDQTFDFLNIAGAIMEDDASTEYFGLEGYINDKMGTTLKAAAGFGLAAATGLNIDSDVIDVLEGDFALYTSIFMDENETQIPALGILLNESGQGENYATAVASTLDRAGYPITRVPLRDGTQAIDLSALTDPFVLSMLGGSSSGVAVADDPRYDVWFGSAYGVMAFGTAPSVQFALGGGDDSLANTEAYLHAVESVFLGGAQGIVFVNAGALESLAVNEQDQAFVRLVESVSASAFADTAGLTGRFAVTLK